MENRRSCSGAEVCHAPAARGERNTNIGNYSRDSRAIAREQALRSPQTRRHAPCFRCFTPPNFRRNPRIANGDTHPGNHSCPADRGRTAAGSYELVLPMSSSKPPDFLERPRGHNSSASVILLANPGTPAPPSWRRPIARPTPVGSRTSRASASQRNRTPGLRPRSPVIHPGFDHVRPPASPHSLRSFL